MTSHVLIAIHISLLLLTSALANSESDPIASPSPGVNLVPLRSPIFYSTYYPVLYEFQLPQWREDDLRLKWTSGHSNTCNSSEAVGFWTGVGCPSVYHYNTVIARFYEKTRELAFGTGVLSTVSTNSKDGDPVAPISCEQISTHFGHESKSPMEWQAYLDILASCPVRKVHKEDVNSQFSKLDLTKLGYMLKRYYEYYTASVASHNTYAAGATYTNAYSAYQSTALLDHFSEMLRWTQAITICENGRLPPSLVSQANLAKTLDSIRLNLVPNSGYNFSISSKEQSQYFKLPLTDCTFSQNKTLMVRSLLPLKSVGSDFQLFAKVQVLPFVQEFDPLLQHNLVCTLDLEIGSGGTYIYDRKAETVLKSDCKSGELCFIKENNHWANFDKCVASLFTRDEVKVQKDCKDRMRCDPVPTKHFPLFVRTNPDTLLVAGHSSKKYEIFVSCRGNPYKVIKPRDTGALRVQLPCDCKVVYQGQEFHAYQPCQDKFNLVNLVPLLSIPDKNKDTISLTTINPNSDNLGTSTGVTGVPLNSLNAQVGDPDLNLLNSEREDSSFLRGNEGYLVWLSLTFGLFGFVSFIWNVVDNLVFKRRLIKNNLDTNSGYYDTVTFQAGRNENPKACILHEN